MPKYMTVEQYVNGELNHILINKSYRGSKPPYLTFELQRLGTLNLIFFVTGSGFEWVKDNKGLFRRMERDFSKKRKPFTPYYKPNPSKTCQELYDEIIVAYKSIPPSQNHIEWFASTPWADSYHTDDEGFIFKKQVSLYEPYDKYSWGIWPTEEPLDFTKIHPNYKKALLELIDYTLSLDEPFKSYLDTLNGQILPDHTIERRLKTVDQLRQIKSILSN
jgi:hypothetical protein